MKIYNGYLYQFLFCLSLVWITGTQAQNRHLKLSASADMEYTNLKYTQAITLYQQIVRKHPADAYAISRIADCYWRMRDFNNALLWYEKLQVPVMDSVNMTGYIHVLMANGHYAEAQKRCNEYINLHPAEKKIGGLLQHLQHLDLFFRDSANWKTDFININSNGEDFCPVFYNKGFVFVSNRSKNERIKKRTAHSINVPSFCKIYYISDTADIKTLPGYEIEAASENKGVLSWEGGLHGEMLSNKNPAIHLLNMGVKTRLNIGPVTFSRDGKTAYYNWNGKIQKDLGVSRLELFSASYNNGNFTGESSFKYNGTDYSVEHPSLSPDGQFLYFASNKKGGVGAFDIYSCKRKDSTWDIPKNLGKLVNTDGNEMFPFADALGNLYFASDGWPGLGALDIFYVQMKDGLPVGPPLNLGYPVNSSYDDFGIVLAANNTSGYFSSNRRKGNDDIYHFEYLKNEKENVKVPVLDTVSRMRTDGVVVNGKEETINNWSVYVNGSSADTVSRLWVNGALINREEEKNRPDNRLIYVIGTVLDSITKLHMDGVTVDMTEVNGTDNFHFVTNNSGNFGAYWKNECLLDITLRKPGYHVFHMRVNTEQLSNHFLMVFLKAGIDIITADSIVIQKSPVRITSPVFIDRTPKVFEEELRHLTDSLQTVVLKKFSVYYNLGSATINPGNESVIDSVVRIAKGHPESSVLVAGFTDCHGDFVVNAQLAKKRAGTVGRLLQKLGLQSSRINVTYFAKKRLIVPCRESRSYDKEEQWINRRSEIVVMEPVKTSALVAEKITGSGSPVVSGKVSGGSFSRSYRESHCSGSGKKCCRLKCNRKSGEKQKLFK
jgi:outer membrane protein OmpA-like peptidoglycan-associated protein/tetratricopeptide (TPR) repeat protein